MRGFVIMALTVISSEAHGSRIEAIGAAGGSIHGKPDWWGKRPFAYPIHKKETGYYFVIECLAPAGSLDELERSLRLADDIVRHKLIRLPESEAERRGMTAAA